jgi:hypothetical protein
MFPLASGATSIATALERKPEVCPAVKILKDSEPDRTLEGPADAGARIEDIPPGPEHAARAASAKSAIVFFIVIPNLPIVIPSGVEGRIPTSFLRKKAGEQALE